MQDRPTAVELLEAAADFVEREVLPATKGRVQFQSRVVANVMRIVAREIQLEDRSLRAEVKALARLLAEPDPHLHGLDDLQKASHQLGDKLSAKIRAGEADNGAWREQVLFVVRQSVEDKLKIANPRYLENDLRIRKTSKG